MNAKKGRLCFGRVDEYAQSHEMTGINFSTLLGLINFLSDGKKQNK